LRLVKCNSLILTRELSAIFFWIRRRKPYCVALFGGDCSTETDQPRAPVDHRRSVADVQSVAVAELTGRGSTTDTHLEVDATATALVAVGATRPRGRWPLHSWHTCTSHRRRSLIRPAVLWPASAFLSHAHHATASRSVLI